MQCSLVGRSFSVYHHLILGAQLQGLSCASPTHPPTRHFPAGCKTYYYRMSRSPPLPSERWFPLSPAPTVTTNHTSNSSSSQQSRKCCHRPEAGRSSWPLSRTGLTRCTLASQTSALAHGGSSCGGGGGLWDGELALHLPEGSSPVGGLLASNHESYLVTFFTRFCSQNVF